MPSVADARPPYIQFEFRAEEDRAESLAQGHFVARDVAYVIITPQGSKDQIERVAKDWFKQIEEQARDGRLPMEWLRAFKGHFKDWQEGNEPAVDGTDIRNWPALSPAQVRSLREAQVRTIEDLAVANEELIARIGMGGRALKARAIDWLASAENTGKQAEALSAMKVENAELKAKNEELSDTVQRLGARLDHLEGLQPPVSSVEKL